MAQFQILHPYSNTEWRPVTTEFIYAPHEDQPYLWPSFEEAEAVRQRLLARAPDAELRVALANAAISDVDWQTREKLRFADGTYSPTPWHDEPWYQARHEEHFCHISREQAGKIAFTENDAKAHADRQLVMSPGRYLQRFFSGHLNNNAIEGWCARLSVALQEVALKITQDADEIEAVYVGGPDSCMAHEASFFDGPCHPARVYAGPDTALAYIGSREDATARSVVWPSRKIYTSIYGDVSRLRLLLEGAGYTNGMLNGARIQRIECTDGFVVPYIDNGGSLADNGEHLVIGRGSISSDNTSGTAETCWYCPNCDNEGSAYDTVYLAGGGNEEWCYSCFTSHTTYCSHNKHYYTDDASFVDVYNHHCTDTVLENCAKDYGAVYLDDRGEWWARDCCRPCDASGIWFHASDLTEYHGEWLSDDHLPEPFDDNAAGLANDHILTYRRFRDDIFPAQAGMAAAHPAEDHANIEASTSGRDDRQPPLSRTDEPSSPAIVMTPPASAGAPSYAGV